MCDFIRSLNTIVGYLRSFYYSFLFAASFLFPLPFLNFNTLRRCDQNYGKKNIKIAIVSPYLIVQNGDLAGMGAHSYTKGTATDGSEEAAEYKK